MAFFLNALGISPQAAIDYVAAQNAHRKAVAAIDQAEKFKEAVYLQHAATQAYRAAWEVFVELSAKEAYKSDPRYKEECTKARAFFEKNAKFADEEIASFLRVQAFKRDQAAAAAAPQRPAEGPIRAQKKPEPKLQPQHFTFDMPPSPRLRKENDGGSAAGPAVAPTPVPNQPPADDRIMHMYKRLQFLGSDGNFMFVPELREEVTQLQAEFDQLYQVNQLKMGELVHLQAAAETLVRLNVEYLRPGKETPSQVFERLSQPLQDAYISYKYQMYKRPETDPRFTDRQGFMESCLAFMRIVKDQQTLSHRGLSQECSFDFFIRRESQYLFNHPLFNTLGPDNQQVINDVVNIARSNFAPVPRSFRMEVPANPVAAKPAALGQAALRQEPPAPPANIPLNVAREVSPLNVEPPPRSTFAHLEPVTQQDLRQVAVMQRPSQAQNQPDANPYRARMSFELPGLFMDKQKELKGATPETVDALINSLEQIFGAMSLGDQKLHRSTLKREKADAAALKQANVQPPQVNVAVPPQYGYQQPQPPQVNVAVPPQYGYQQPQPYVGMQQRQPYYAPANPQYGYYWHQ